MKLTARFGVVLLGTCSILFTACGNDAKFSQAELGAESADLSSSAEESASQPKSLDTSPELNKRILSVELYEVYKASVSPENPHPLPPDKRNVFEGRMGLIQIDILAKKEIKSALAARTVEFFSYHGDCNNASAVNKNEMNALLKTLSDAKAVKSVDGLVSDPKVQHYMYLEKVLVERGVSKTTYYIVQVNDQISASLKDAVSLLVKNQQLLRQKNLCPLIPKPVN